MTVALTFHHPTHFSVRKYIEGEEFIDEIEEFFTKYHIDDFNRPDELMHLDMTDPAVFRDNLTKGFAWLYSRIPEELRLVVQGV